MQLSISYHLHESGNYHVNSSVLGQKISVNPRRFRRIMNTGAVVVGFWVIDKEIAQELGFILKSEMHTKAV